MLENFKSQFVEMFGREDYQRKRLIDISTKITDGSHNPPKGICEDSGYYMLSSQNVVNGKINYTNARYLQKEAFDKENKRTQLSKGDVLLTIVGTIGRTAIINDEKNIVLQRSVAVIKPNKEINSVYLNYELCSGLVSKQLSYNSKGVAQKGIYLSSLKNIVILVPPIELQNKFANIVKEIDKQKFIIEQIEKIVNKNQFIKCNYIDNNVILNIKLTSCITYDII